MDRLTSTSDEEVFVFQTEAVGDLDLTEVGHVGARLSVPNLVV